MQWQLVSIPGNSSYGFLKDDLLNTTNIWLEQQGIAVNAPGSEPNRVITTFRIIAKDQPEHDRAIESTLVTLEDDLESGRLYHDQRNAAEHEPLYLQQQTDNEEFPRYSLIYDYELQQNTSDMVNHPLLKARAWFGTLTLTHSRHFYSTNPELRGYYTAGGSTNLVLPATVRSDGTNPYLSTHHIDASSIEGGVYPAKIEELRLVTNHALERLWIGIRPEFQSLYQPAHEAGLPFSPTTSILDNGDTTVVDQGNGTYHMVTGFSYEVLTDRYAIQIPDATYKAGTFLVLYKARVSASDTVARVRLAHAHQPTNTARSAEYFSTEQISNTSFHWYELGLITLDRDMPADWLTIEAERLTGTGALEAERLILLPAEHRIYLENLNMLATDTLIIYTRPNNEPYVSAANDRPSFYPSNWAFPRTGGRIYFIAEGPGGVVSGSTISPKILTAHFGWRTYRNTGERPWS